ncbi:hypothetical protein L9F63_001485, partial [Diploptera punctata]
LSPKEKLPWALKLSRSQKHQPNKNLSHNIGSCIDAILYEGQAQDSHQRKCDYN